VLALPEGPHHIVSRIYEAALLFVEHFFALLCPHFFLPLALPTHPKWITMGLNTFSVFSVSGAAPKMGSCYLFFFFFSLTYILTTDLGQSPQGSLRGAASTTRMRGVVDAIVIGAWDKGTPE
jgi:hypothetical protein